MPWLRIRPAAAYAAVAAVTQFVADDFKGTAPVATIGDEDDYYSASLKLLSNLAAQEASRAKRSSWLPSTASCRTVARRWAMTWTIQSYTLVSVAQRLPSGQSRSGPFDAAKFRSLVASGDEEFRAELVERAIALDFSVRAIRSVDELPDFLEGRHFDWLFLDVDLGRDQCLKIIETLDAGWRPRTVPGRRHRRSGPRRH